MAGRPEFRDHALDDRFEEYGYVVVPGAARRQLRPLRRIHRSLVDHVPPGFHSTPYSSDHAHKKAVNIGIQEALLPVVDTLLCRYRPLLASFISKGSDESGRMPPHMDWTFVDEPEFSSMNFWVPLIDVDHYNGAVSVLPRGHRVPHTIRGSGTDNPFDEIEGEVAKLMVEHPMRAGDVLIHDHRVLHASPPNRTRRPRVVAAMALIPEHAKAVHYRKEADGSLVRYELEDRFFTDHTYGEAQLPASAHRVAPVGFRNPQLRLADLPHEGQAP